MGDPSPTSRLLNRRDPAIHACRLWVELQDCRHVGQIASAGFTVGTSCPAILACFLYASLDLHTTTTRCMEPDRGYKCPPGELQRAVVKKLLEQRVFGGKLALNLKQAGWNFGWLGQRWPRSDLDDWQDGNINYEKDEQLVNTIIANYVSLCLGLRCDQLELQIILAALQHRLNHRAQATTTSVHVHHSWAK